MPDQPIIVDKTPFFGRVEEQKQFIAALQDVLNQAATETLPYIFLLYGDGGIGKTTLAKRFRDIATDRPYRSKFQLLWIDWEDERRQGYPALQVGRSNITPETIFDVIHMVAVRYEWGEHFKAYQAALELREKSEKKAAEALVAADERDELVQIRGLGATAIAKIMRLGIPGIGETGEKLAQAFLNAGIKVGAEQAARLRGLIETRLRARLDPDQFKTYLNPVEQLADALAAGLKEVASTAPLLIFLDTYEIVDRADTALRQVICAAGARVTWIVSGRNDLVRGRKFGAEYFKGYADEFARRLLTYNMRQLALEDIGRYFAARVPQRPLSTEETEAISRATHGIPLAVCEAADIWEKGLPLNEIVGDTTEATPRPQIVRKMTDRYLLHVVTNTDRHALYALALAHGDVEVLHAMLCPTDADKLDLDDLLHRLERDYASVHADTARLHDESSEFLQEYLRVEVRRKGEEVQTLNQRAVAALRERLKKLETDLPLIEERCENEDWAKATLDLTYHLFWLDEAEAWHWFIPRFVESLAYDSSLQQGLLEIAADWKTLLSATPKKRLKALTPLDSRSVEDDEEAMLGELSQLESKGWLKGDGEAERRAILDLRRGQLLYDHKQYTEALAQYEKAERGLPDTGETLKKQLGEALYELAGQFMWPENQTIAVYSADAERILPKVVTWLPDKQGAWYRLGGVLNRGGKNDKSIAAFQRAIELDPKFAAPHNGLGNLYYILGHTDEAIAEYQTATDLDPKEAAPHHGLGNVYRNLGRIDDALTEYRRAIDLDPKFAEPHQGLGIVYQSLGQSEKALTEFKQAVELAPNDGAYLASLVGILIKLGRDAESAKYLKIARELIAREDEYNRACFEAICGNVDEALALLKVALEKKQANLLWARRDPDFDNIRSDPRFSALVGEADGTSSTEPKRIIE